MWLAFLPKLTFFAKIGDPCDPNKSTNPFFGLPHWWKYIKNGEMDGFGNCTPVVKMPDGIWAIGFAVIDMMIFLAGIVAVIMIIVAGAMFLTSGGNAEKAASARKRIVNSLVGLVIVIIAGALVAFIGNTIK